MRIVPYLQRHTALFLGCCLAAGILLVFLTPGPPPLAPVQAAERAEEPLVGKVRGSIKRAVQYLRTVEDGKGHWEVDTVSLSNPGGWTSLAMLALLNAGVSPDDPIIGRGLKYLRGVKSTQTYVVGLQTMVFALAGKNEDKGRMQDSVNWLIETRVAVAGTKLLGWDYGGKTSMGRPDGSCTQYALLGLHEAHQAGAKIPREVWQSVLDYYKGTQETNLNSRDLGGWRYLPNHQPSFTMTCAGLCGLLMARQNLNVSRDDFLKDGTHKNCGQRDEDPNIAYALDWIGKRFPGNMGDLTNLYYALYGIERAGRLSGRRFLGRHDWYREGCQFLVKTQQPDGSWKGPGAEPLSIKGSQPVLTTSFALLFLSKGRIPVLISKLAHGKGSDWNNDPNDARHLVEYASRELFKKEPLAWQVFDINQINTERAQEVEDALADLLASPIVYFNGHESPKFPDVLTDRENGLLKRYIEQGGFLLAEACCGRENFQQGFELLMKDLFPDQLKRLPNNHPIWTAKFTLDPVKDKLELWGVEMGCRTVVVYSPKDLSCAWESNDYTGRAEKAFQLGANIIAYATGLELPQDRGTRIEIIKDDPNEKKLPRGALKVAQLRYGRSDGDWKPAPRAMRNLLFELRDLGLKVDLRADPIDVPDANLKDFKFLYLHGRNAFSFKEHLKHLQFNLKHGGLLFADACCGSKPFDKSFRELVVELFGQELKPIPPDDELFSKELNGVKITEVRCRREGPDGKPETELRSVAPALEGVKVNSRWVVIYSKYDIGCALEKSQSTNCLGHDHASAVLLGKAVVLYALKR